MNTFTLNLYDATRTQSITGVTSFVGEDASGSFGILPGHARFITTLTFGLARFRTGSEYRYYLAVPGAALYFAVDTLTISTRHYFIDADYERITLLLQEKLLQEESSLQATKDSLRRMEQEIFKRLWTIAR